MIKLKSFEQFLDERVDSKLMKDVNLELTLIEVWKEGDSNTSDLKIMYKLQTKNNTYDKKVYAYISPVTKFAMISDKDIDIAVDVLIKNFRIILSEEDTIFKDVPENRKKIRNLIKKELTLKIKEEKQDDKNINDIIKKSKNNKFIVDSIKINSTNAVLNLYVNKSNFILTLPLWTKEPYNKDWDNTSRLDIKADRRMNYEEYYDFISVYPDNKGKPKTLIPPQQIGEFFKNKIKDYKSILKKITELAKQSKLEINSKAAAELF